MVANISARIARISDRMLVRVAPKITAEAICGGWRYCCGWNGFFWELGQYRYDPEHEEPCTACYALERNC